MARDLEFEKEVKRANALLQRLQGHFETTKLFTAKTLINRLSQKNINGITEKGFIKFNQNLTKFQKTAILKAVQDFNKSKTATVEGVRETVDKIKEKYMNKYDITAHEADVVYRFINSAEYTQSEINQIYSEVIAIAIESAKYENDEEFFLEMLRQNIREDVDISDKELQEELKQIYRKYIEEIKE